MKALVAAFNQEKAQVGAFSVITNLRVELFEALVPRCPGARLLLGKLMKWGQSRAGSFIGVTPLTAPPHTLHTLLVMMDGRNNNLILDI